MKKTLVTLLAAAVLVSSFGTVSFAAETEMTPIPDAPALEQQYVHFQADGTVKTPGYTDYAEMNGNYHRGVEAACATCGSNHCSYKNVAYNNGYFYRPDPGNGQFQYGFGEGRAKRYASYSTGSSANGIGTSRYGYFRWGDSGYAGNGYIDSIHNMVELAFETLGSDNGTETTADSGYLMLHTQTVKLTANYSSFGFGLVSGDLIGSDHGKKMEDDYLYVAVVLEGNDTNGWKSYLQFQDTKQAARGSNWGWGAGGQYRQLEISDYVKKDTDFDIKVLANLDTDTYGIYIDNRPVVLDLAADPVACPNVGGINLAITEANGSEAFFGTSSCYPVSEADANQFKQAAWERAFNSEPVSFITNSGGTSTGILICTSLGGAQTQWSKEHGHFYEFAWKSQGENVDKGYNTKFVLKQEGLSGLKVYEKYQSTGVNDSYTKFYLLANNIADYDYDKLDLLILCGDPTVDALNGTLSGTYIAAGGLGMKRIPRVVTASYTKNGEYETVYDAKVTEGLNGEYKGDISEIDIPDVANRKLAHYVWGGFDRLTPLYGESVIEAFTE